jgi:hypothetical protein
VNYLFGKLHQAKLGVFEIRDRSFENQRYQASGLNLVVYLERAILAATIGRRCGPKTSVAARGDEPRCGR